jgi:hypothetical protein
MTADSNYKELRKKLKALEKEAAARKKAEAQLKKQSYPENPPATRLPINGTPPVIPPSIPARWKLQKEPNSRFG